jgi:hypothetical protein
MNIFAIHHTVLNYVPSGTPRRCAMWRMGTTGSLIFIAVVAVMVALLVLLAR